MMIDKFISKMLIELPFLLKLHTKTNLPFSIIQQEGEIDREREKRKEGSGWERKDKLSKMSCKNKYTHNH